MKTLITIGLLLVVIAGALVLAPRAPYGVLPADFRDAVGDTGGFDTALPSFDSDAYPVPLPTAPERFGGQAWPAAMPDDDIMEDPPAGPEPQPWAAEGAKGLKKAVQTGPCSPLADTGGLVPADLKERALQEYCAHRGSVTNTRHLGVVDYGRNSAAARFYLLDLESGDVKVIRVAHGIGSDPDNDGNPTVFSNENNTHASSLGVFLTGEIYSGKHGRSMRLHGLSPSNSNAYRRAVVVHEASYVVENPAVRPGRSWGCLAVSAQNIGAVINQLSGGAVIYAGFSKDGSAGQQPAVTGSVQDEGL